MDRTNYGERDRLGWSPQHLDQQQQQHQLHNLSHHHHNLAHNFATTTPSAISYGEETPPSLSPNSSRPPQIPVASYAAADASAFAPNAIPTEVLGASLSPDDFYRSYRGVQTANHPGVLLPSPIKETPMATTAPSNRPNPSLRSNGNGTTPKHPALPASRNGQRPVYRPSSNTADDGAAVPGTRSASASSNGYGGTTQPSVKDLKKRFDQTTSQPGTATRRTIPRASSAQDTTPNGSQIRPPGGQNSYAALRNGTTREQAGEATRSSGSRSTQRAKFVPEDQLSSNTQSFASRINRPRNGISTNALASKSMTNLSPTSPQAPSSPQSTSSRSNGLLFGEILPEQSNSATAGFGIDHARQRRTSDSNLDSPVRMHQRSMSDHDMEPPSPTDWYRDVPAPPQSGDTKDTTRIPRTHNRALSDHPRTAAHQHRSGHAASRESPNQSIPIRSSSPSSRLPLSVKKLNSPSNPGSASSTRSNSPSSGKRPVNSGRTSRQHGPPPVTRAKTPTNRSTTPTARSKTPTHSPNTTRKPAPQGLVTPGSNRLNAYVSIPPPKLSPTLRSSRPRQSVATATTASSRMRAMASRSSSPNKQPTKAGTTKPEEPSGRRRKISMGPVDFAQRRETIKLAYSKSIRETQAKEARQAAAERRKKELEAVAKAKARAEAVATAAAAAATATADSASPTDSQDVLQRTTIATTREDLLRPEEPLKISTDVPPLPHPQIVRQPATAVDSPTLGGIPGSFPDLGSPEIEQEEIPQSAVSNTSAFTEFDNEPQTEPPVQEGASLEHLVRRQSVRSGVSSSASGYQSHSWKRISYHSPFDEEDGANDDSVSIKISLDTSGQASLQPTPTRSGFDVEPAIPGSFQDDDDEYVPGPYAYTSPVYETTVKILGPEAGFSPTVQDEIHGDPIRRDFSEPPAAVENDSSTHHNLDLQSSGELEEAPVLHRYADIPAEETLERIEDFYHVPKVQDNVAALRDSTLTLSEPDAAYDAQLSSSDAQKTPDTSRSLAVPSLLSPANRSSQHSVWTDYSFGSSDGQEAVTRDFGAGARDMDGRDWSSITSQARPELASHVSDLENLPESPELSPLDQSQESIQFVAPSSFHNRHQLPELDTGAGFTVRLLPDSASHVERTDAIPPTPDHEPPPPPDEYVLDESTYYVNTRPNSYLQIQNDADSEELPPPLSTPHSVGQMSVESVAVSTKPTSTKEVAGPTGKEKSRLTQRQWVIRELVDTEAIFVRDMSVVEEIYKGTAEACPNLDGKTIKLIFRNTDEIINFHTSFLAQLKEGVSSVYAPKGRSHLFRQDSAKDLKKDSDAVTVNSTTSSGTGPGKSEIDDEKDRLTSIGPLFSANIEGMMAAHEGYLRSSDSATKRLIQIQEDPAVKVWLSECNEVAKDLTAAWNLDSLLIKPMQRLTKYPNLISQLLEYTPTDHPDREALLAAKTAVENTILDINKTKKNFELVGQIVGARKRKESDVRAGIARAFGKRAPAPPTAEDEEYMKLKEKFGDDYLRLQVVLRDVEYYTRTVSTYVHEFLQYLSSMELVMRLQPSPYPELESKWVQFNVSMRDIGKVALEQHLSSVRKDVIEPFEQVIRCYSNPSLAMKKREKRRGDYDRSVQLKKGGKKVDKQLAELVEQYEALNDTLKKELPKLSALTAKVGNICLGKFVSIQASWYLIWKEKVKAPLEASANIPEFAEIISTFQREFKDVEESAQTIGILNPSLKIRTSQSTSDDVSILSKTRSRPSEIHTPRGRGLSINSDTVPTLPTPDFAKRLSGQITLSPTGTGGNLPSPGHYYRDYYAGINGHARGGSGSPIAPAEAFSSSRSVAPSAPSARPSTGRSYESSAAPRASTDSTAQTSVSNRRDSNPLYVSNYPPPAESRRFSGLFHSALPLPDNAEESQRSSRASSRERATSNGGYNIMWLAASLFEFNIETTKHEAGYPYLTYQAGEIFDVIAEKGELWLAKNQDDPRNVVGWIWSKHFAKLADS